MTTHRHVTCGRRVIRLPHPAPGVGVRIDTRRGREPQMTPRRTKQVIVAAIVAATLAVTLFTASINQILDRQEAEQAENAQHS